MALAKKVEQRIESLDQLRGPTDRCTPQFFEQVVEWLRILFDADFGMLFEVATDQSSCRLAVAAMRNHGLRDREHALTSAIAADVIRRGHAFVSAGARQRYPRDGLLEQAGIEAYHAVALVDAEGKSTGVLAIGHASPLELDREGELLLEFVGRRIQGDWCQRNEAIRRPSCAQVSVHSGEHQVIHVPGESPLPHEMLASTDVDANGAPVSSTRPPLAEPFRRFFELGTVGMAIVGVQGEIWDVNDCLCKMLKRPRAEVVKTKWTELTHDDDLGRELALLAELLDGRSAEYNIDKRFRLPDGLTLTTNVSVRCSRNASGGIEYLALLARDVSQERLLEQQLLHSQKLEAVGRLAGGIAHDFNNLLTAMLAYTDVTEAGDQQAVAEMIVGVRDAAMRAANLTGQLLAFARRQVIEPKVLDLNQVVQSTTHLLRRIVGEDIDLVTQITQELWCVRLDPGQVEQILANLSVNARDAMPLGGRLLIGTANVPSHTVAELLGPSATVTDYVLIMVADTGHGMAEDVLSHLFEPFFTTKDASRGSGLGLATCHGIVSQNGGHIRVTSSPGYGTTFRIYFPRHLSEAGAKPSVPPTMQGVSVSPSETILLVEDDDMVRRVAVRVLKNRGYNVLSAVSGIEALEIAREHRGPIALLLTDLVMPKMNGDRLAKELVAKRPGTKVLLTSGYAESEFEQGVGVEMAFLQKPYTPRQLSDRVRKILDR